MDKAWWDEMSRRYAPELEAYQKLVGLGADPKFTFNLLTRFPFKDIPPLRHLLALYDALDAEECGPRLEKALAYLRATDDFRRLRSTRWFAQACPLAQQLTRMLSLALQHTYALSVQPIAAAMNHVKGDDPIGALIDQRTSPVKRRGRPSDDLVTLFMATVIRHLKARGQRPQYAQVGEITKALFPGKLQSEEHLAHNVRNRCQSFLNQPQASRLLDAIDRRINGQ